MKKILILLTALVSANTAFADNSKRVCLFEHANYGGQKSCYATPTSNAGADTKISFLRGSNDKASSVKVPPNTKVVLFQHAAFKGSQITLLSGNHGFIHTFNDQASSLIISANTAIADNSKRVCLFEHDNYGGERSCYATPTSNAGADTKISFLRGSNDKASSIKVPPNTKVVLFQHAAFKGSQITLLSGNHGSLHTFNDQASSLIIERVRDNEICFFEHANFRGEKACYSGLAQGNRSKLHSLSAFNDKASSVIVPPGTQITIFQDDSARGRTTTLTPGRHTFLHNFNDEASSVLVEPLLVEATVCFYTAPNFRGESDCHTLPAGQRRLSVYSIGRFNDRYASAQLPNPRIVRVKVEAWQEPRFARGLVLIPRSDANLGRFRNTISSFEIIRN